jgi:hypothetical protein
MSHLIDTNNPPSEKELLATRQILTNKEEELASLEVEIAKRSLSPPFKERDKIREFIKAHLTILSPAKRAPRDIWELIFCRCLPDTQFTRPSPKDAPLLLGRVCQAWRTISFSMPRLWTSIAVEFDYLPPPMRLIESWLARAGACPLSLQIRDLQFGNGASDDLTALLSIFISLFDQWAHVDFHLPQNFCLQLTDRPAPMLETINISTKDHPTDIRFGPTPRLKSCEWSSETPLLFLPRNCCHLSFDEPLIQMTSLSLTCSLSPEGAYNILCQCPALVDCSLNICQPGPSPWPIDRPEILLPILVACNYD